MFLLTLAFGFRADLTFGFRAVKNNKQDFIIFLFFIAYYITLQIHQWHELLLFKVQYMDYKAQDTEFLCCLFKSSYPMSKLKDKKL